MDIQHPDIERIERTGYPSDEYIQWEKENDSSSSNEDEHN